MVLEIPQQRICVRTLCHLCQIKAKGNIEVAEYISHSELEAGDSVLVGQSRGKGQLISGHTLAGNRVMAKIPRYQRQCSDHDPGGAAADTVPRLRAVMQKIRRIEQDIRAIQKHSSLWHPDEAGPH